MSFLGNLSFLGFKRDGDMNLYYIKWKILPKMYFLLCKKRKICSTEIFSTHQMGRYDPFGVMGVSVLRVYGLSVASPFYTVANARYRLRNAATYVERCETR